MYYLLGHGLKSKNFSDEREKEIARNTFILALDGDIKFKPDAVDMLLDLMKKNAKCGAACGRVHPTGSGTIVWYQKFEYAIGHWFQKSTEHVFGTALCAPGCFALLRAEALMDTSVLDKYKTEPDKAKDYIQFDQGEDRWLCTLMIQQGWRIEYCAGADSVTNAPDSKFDQS